MEKAVQRATVMPSRRHVLAAAASVGLASTGTPVHAGDAARLILRRNRLFVPATVAGVTIQALLDSAAEITLLDRAFAARAGIGHGQAVSASGSGAGSMDAEVVEGVPVSAFGIAMTTEVAVIDLTDISRRLNGARLDVILGRDLFDQARLDIDFDRRTVRTVDRALPVVGTELALTGEHGVETVPVVCEGRTANATFDLGNGSHVLVSRDFVEAAGMLKDGRHQWHETGGGLGGAADLTVFRLASLEVAGRTFRNVVANIDAGKNAADLNIGVGILRHFHIVTDFSERKVWLG